MINILNTNEVTDFLIRNPEITINQLFFCLLHMHDQEFIRKNGLQKIERPLSRLYAYYDSRGGKNNAFVSNDFKTLLDKEFIKVHGNTYRIDLITVTEKFKRELYGEKIKFEEFIDKYPNYITNFDHPGKPMINLKVFRNRIGTEKSYLSKVKTNKAHNRVLDILDWAIDNNQINMNIENFIESEMWDQLDQLREETGLNHNIVDV